MRCVIHFAGWTLFEFFFLIFYLIKKKTFLIGLPIRKAAPRSLREFSASAENEKRRAIDLSAPLIGGRAPPERRVARASSVAAGTRERSNRRATDGGRASRAHNKSAPGILLRRIRRPSDLVLVAPSAGKATPKRNSSARTPQRPQRAAPHFFPLAAAGLNGSNEIQ